MPRPVRPARYAGNCESEFAGAAPGTLQGKDRCAQIDSQDCEDLPGRVGAKAVQQRAEGVTVVKVAQGTQVGGGWQEGLTQRTQCIAAVGIEALCVGVVSAFCAWVDFLLAQIPIIIVAPGGRSIRIRSKGPRLFEAAREAVICRGSHVNVPFFRCSKPAFDPALQIAAIRRAAAEDQQRGHSKASK